MNGKIEEGLELCDKLLAEDHTEYRRCAEVASQWTNCPMNRRLRFRNDVWRTVYDECHDFAVTSYAVWTMIQRYAYFFDGPPKIQYPLFERLRRRLEGLDGQECERLNAEYGEAVQRRQRQKEIEEDAALRRYKEQLSAVDAMQEFRFRDDTKPIPEMMQAGQ